MQVIAYLYFSKRNVTQFKRELYYRYKTKDVEFVFVSELNSLQWKWNQFWKTENLFPRKWLIEMW
jgi:hypothetical protein